MILKIRRLLKKLLLLTGAFQIYGMATYFRDYWRFRCLSSGNNRPFPVRWKNRYPCLNEKTLYTEFDPHYIYHPAWAARILSETRPEEHVDISSTLNFCSLVSAFIPIRFYDYRPAQLNLSGLNSGHANLLHLPFEDDSIQSLSCMHVIEHLGLGRYGEPLDPNADEKSISELKRVLAPEGTLLFVTPIGQPRLMFNAHRIYSYNLIIELFSDLELVQFALVPDAGHDLGLIYNASPELANAQKYGCGCFWFRKR